MPVNFEMSFREIGAETAVISLIGEVDVYTAPKAKEAILGLLDRGIRHLIVNLAPTEYLDSTALGMFVGILRRLQEKGGSLHLVAPPLRLRRLFEITRLERI